MIIRSQDKKYITTDMNLEIVTNDTVVYTSFEDMLNGNDKGSNSKISSINNSSGVLLGKYSTEEKAIKVLDMICAEYQYAEECKHTGVGSAPPEFVFQMPSDEEGECNMKEFIEKLIGRLEEKFKYNSEQAEIWGNGPANDAYIREKKDLYMDRANTYGEVMRIVNQLAEEYRQDLDKNSQGWIPCSERLPDKSGWFLCTQEYHSLTNRKFIKVTTELVEFYDNKWRRANNLVVTHWQPLPHPYQPKGE